MTWTPDAPLDSLCERLWDLVRYAYVDLDQTANFNAREWYASQTPGRFPLDERTLFLTVKRKHDNVIHYRRVSERTERGSWRTEPTPPPRETPAEPEVTFLSEVSAPVRSMPATAAPVPSTPEPHVIEAASAPVARDQRMDPIGADDGTRIFEIRDTETSVVAAETSEIATETVEKAPPARSASRTALRPLPPPAPDEGIVFLE